MKKLSEKHYGDCPTCGSTLEIRGCVTSSYVSVNAKNLLSTIDTLKEEVVEASKHVDIEIVKACGLGSAVEVLLGERDKLWSKNKELQAENERLREENEKTIADCKSFIIRKGYKFSEQAALLKEKDGEIERWKKTVDDLIAIIKKKDNRIVNNLQAKLKEYEEAVGGITKLLEYKYKGCADNVIVAGDKRYAISVRTLRRLATAGKEGGCQHIGYLLIGDCPECGAKLGEPK